MGEGEEEREIRVRGGHQQEAEHAATPSTTLTPERVSSQEARGGHLQDKHGKEAPGATPRKQEQPG